MLRYTCWLTALLMTVLPWQGMGQILYAPGQVPNQAISKNRYKITGVVSNSATGEPIMRAVVRIEGSTLPQVFTDGSGRFEMNDVPEGQMTITAQRPGFLGSEVVSSRFHTVTIGPATPPIEIKLVPQGIVQGRVTNGESEPLEGVGVQLLYRQIANGRKEWALRGNTQTDENGEYQVEDLPPGQYLLSTSLHVLAPFAAVAENGPTDDAYPPQYFPNAPERDSAQPIHVQAGQTAEADFRLSPVRSFSVSGAVSGPENTNISCQDAGGNALGSGQMDHRTGKFKLLHVPPGACTLTFQGQGGQEANFKTYYAEQAITISSSDIDNLRISMQPLPDVPVRFPDSAGSVPLQLELMPRQKRAFFQQFYLMNQPGQMLVFQNVPPGSYQLVVHNSGGACVNTLSQGGTDLLREDLTVAGGSARTEPIEVTLRNDCAALSGTVKTNLPGYAGTVLVISSAGGMEPRIAPIINGNFAVSGLAPGDYTVYAFTDVSNLEYANPEALREFSGQKVTLGPSAKTTMQLDLITRGEGQ